VTSAGGTSWARRAVAGAASLLVVAAIVDAVAAAAAAPRRWSAPSAISGPYGQEAQAVVDGAGDGFVAWTEYATGASSVLVSERSAAAAGWSPPQTLAAAGARLAGIAADRRGDVLVVWTGPAGVQASMRPAGGAWGPAQAVSGSDDSAVTQVAVGLDAAGDATAIWSRGSGIEVATQAAGAPSWGDPIEIASSGDERLIAPSLAVNDAGDAVAVWIRGQATTGGTVEGSARQGPAGPWEAPQTLSIPGEFAEYPSAAIDAPGGRVAVWTAFTGSDVQTQAASRARDAATWMPPVDLGSGRTTDGPRVGVGASGTIVAWVTGSGRVHASSLAAVGRPWQDEGDLSTPDAFAPALATAPDGAAVIAWQRLRDDGLASIEGELRTVDGIWGPKTQLSAAGGTGSYVGRPAVARGPGGDALVAWSGHASASARDVVSAAVFTRESEPGPRTRPAAVTGVAAPKQVRAGAVARLQVTLDHAVDVLAVRVEHRVGNRFVPLARGRIGGLAGAVPVRLTHPGRETLRIAYVQGGRTRRTAAVAIRVTRPAVGLIPAGVVPVDITTGAGSVWVLANRDGRVSSPGEVWRIDARTRRPVGRPTQVGSGASAIAVSAGRLWVTTLGPASGGSLTRFDLRSGRRVGSPIELTQAPGPPLVAGGAVWLTGFCQRPSLIGSTTGYGGCTAGSLMRVDAATGRLTTVPLPDGYLAAALADDGGSLWLAGTVPGAQATVERALRVDPRTLAVVQGIDFGSSAGYAEPPDDVADGPWSIAQAAGTVWVAHGPTLVRIGSDGSHQTLVAPGCCGRTVGDLAVATDGRTIWTEERRVPAQGRFVRREVLLQGLDPADASSVGRPRGLDLPVPPGTAGLLFGQRFTVGFGALWVTSPAEGALVRVALPAR